MSCGYTAPVYCNGSLVCEKCEAFCQATAKSHSINQLIKNGGGAAPTMTLKKDDIIIKTFNKDVWNSLRDYINEQLTKGGQQHSGDEIPPLSPGVGQTFITAEDMNKLVDGINKLGGSVSNFVKNNVIYAAEFNVLFTSLDSGKYAPGACDQCNTGCDISCKNCISCNSCQNSSCWDCYD